MMDSVASRVVMNFSDKASRKVVIRRNRSQGAQYLAYFDAASMKPKSETASTAVLAIIPPVASFSSMSDSKYTFVRYEAESAQLEMYRSRVELAYWRRG